MFQASPLGARTTLALVTGVTIAFGLFAAGVATLWIKNIQDRHASYRFERVCDRLESEIDRRMGVFQYGLRSARGVLIACNDVSNQQFQRYFLSRDLSQEFRGSYAVGYARRADTRSSTLTLALIEPPETPGLTLGQEMSEIPGFLQAAEASVDSGMMEISAITTIPGESRADVVYAVLAVFDTAKPTTTPELRRAAWKGTIFKPIRVSATLAGIEKTERGAVEVTVSANDINEKPMTLYESDVTGAREAAGEDTSRDSLDRTRPAAFRHERAIVVGGINWRIHMWSTPRFTSDFDREARLMGLGGGVLLSFALGGLVYSLGSTRVRALRLAEVMTQELTEAKRKAEDALHDFSVLRHAIDRHALVSVADAQGRFVDVNDNLCTLTGYSRAELIGRTERDIASPKHPKAFWNNMQRSTGGGAIWRDEVCIQTKDGSIHWLDTTIVPFTDMDGKVSTQVAIRADITARKELESELRTAAQRDKLTDLPSRALVIEQLTEHIRRRQEGDPRHFAVLFLDFDRFKLVNDSLGHEAGDDLLRQIADRMRKVLHISGPESVDGTGTSAGRMGGDEFVVILGMLFDQADAQVMVNRLLEAFRHPYRIGKHEVVSTASIGVVTSETDYDRAEDMLRDADTAMYEAKLAGKGCAVYFDHAMRDRVRDRMELESDLRRAIPAGELWIAFQPIVSFDGSRGSGCEALVRWRHPTRGDVSPVRFIPIAEETGLIFDIGNWVLTESCHLLARWKRDYPHTAPATIAVNLSRAQLAMDDLPGLVSRVLAESGLPPEALRLEVTENQVVSSRSNLLPILQRLKALGVSLAMDDFGTGLSSLSGLQQLPFDVVKVDRSFVVSLGQRRELMAMAHSIINLSANLGLLTIAEGVETEEQVTMLQALGCDYAQGYYFSKPLSVEQMEKHLAGGAVYDYQRRKMAA